MAATEWSTATRGRLQKLEMYHNRIEFVHPRALEGLTSLTHLDLGRNQLETLDGSGLEVCPALSTLVLSQNLLGTPPAPLRLPLLTELWLSGNRISSMGGWAAEPPPSRPSPLPTPAFEGPPVEESNRLHTPITKWGSCDQNGCSKSPVTSSRGNAIGGCQSEVKGGKRRRDDDSVSHDGSVTVWLPSLEVLHLQDNVLESLGGRWSLAGVPLLRSLDVSFNRVQKTNDVAACIGACGVLEEIRLHDNPVAGCVTYADSVALSCPRVSKGCCVRRDPLLVIQLGRVPPPNRTLGVECVCIVSEYCEDYRRETSHHQHQREPYDRVKEGNRRSAFVRPVHAQNWFPI